METLRVLILCAPTLFCAGIQCILGDEPVIEVVGVKPLAAKSLKSIGTLRPDVVIVAASDNTAQAMFFTGKILQSHADLAVIQVSLEKDTVQIYHSHRVPARSADLKEALRHLRDP